MSNPESASEVWDGNGLTLAKKGREADFGKKIMNEGSWDIGWKAKSERRIGRV
jgi:hypothetical protein